MSVGEKIYNAIYSAMRFITGSRSDSPRKKKARYAVLFFVALIANILLGKNITNGSYPWYANVSIFLLLNINIILVLILFIVLFRNIATLMADRRKKVFGARLQTKLVIFCVILVAVPVFTTYIISTRFIRDSIDRWFDGNVNRMVYSSSDMAKHYIGSQTSRLSDITKVLSEKLEENGMNTEQTGSSDIQLFTQDYIDKKIMNGITVYYGSKLAYTQQNVPGNLFDFVEPRLIRSVLGGHAQSGHTLGEIRPGFWAAVPIFDGEKVTGAVFAVNIISIELAEDVSEITEMYELFKQLRFFSHPVRKAFYVSHYLIALLVIFASIWGSMVFVRSITTPLKNLAAASRRISKGDLDVKVDVTGNDEITLLSRSFNDMSMTLKRSTLELQRKNEDLNEALNQISRDKEYIDTIYRNVESAIILFDTELNVLKANNYAEELIHKSNEELHDYTINTMTKFLESNDNEQLVQSSMRFEDESKLFTVHLNKIFDHDGELENVLLVLDDNTHFMNLQRITLWKEVATRITHEIKNPLTPIKLTAERVKRRGKEIAEPAVKELVVTSMQTIINEVEELLNLVEEFNLYARMPSTIRSDVRLASLIDEIMLLQDVSPSVKIHVDVPDSLTVTGDKYQLKRVLVNLIQNAMQELGESGNIYIKAMHDHDNSVSLIVEDDGKGIKEEDLQSVFIPYFSKKPSGTGLGLAIVKKIIEEHGGTISVESSRGEYARFHIHLPVA